MNITQEQDQQDEKPVKELTKENIADIERVLDKYGVIPVKYYRALLNTAKKGLKNDLV